MANEYMQVSTAWGVYQQDEETARSPVLFNTQEFLDLGLFKFQDITGQPSEIIIPDPNSYTIEVWGPTEAMDAIDADVRFVVVPESRINLDELPPDPEEPVVASSQVPTQLEFDAYRLALLNVRNEVIDENIWTVSQVTDAIGVDVNGRTWDQINAELLAYQQGTAKGTFDFQIQPVQLPDGSVGYDIEQPGAAVAPRIDGVRIGLIATNPTLDGVFGFGFDTILPITDRQIKGIQILGRDEGFNTRDAFFDIDRKLWVWFNTEFNMEIGRTYTVVVTT